MEKEELLNRIAEAFGAADKEIKIAYDAFLQKISEELIPDEAVRIPGLGVFQIKSKPLEKPENSSITNSNVYYRLFYFPETSNEVVELDFSYSGKSKIDSPETAFSLSTGKPLIPILESQKKELLVQSSYINLLNDYREKADELFSEAVKLDNFNLDAVTEEKLHSYIEVESDSIDEKSDEIPWNFGDVLSDELKQQEVNEQPEIEKGLNIGAEDLKTPDFNLSDFPDEKTVKEEDFSGLNLSENEAIDSGIENIDEENNQNQEKELDLDNLGEDFFNLSESDLGIEDKKSDESTLSDYTETDDLIEENENSTGNEDTGDEEASEEEYDEADTTDEEDSGEEETEEEVTEETKDKDEVISIDVNKAREYSTSRTVPLEEVDGSDIDDHYSSWFWVVLIALVFITGGGIYYFFFYNATAQNENVPVAVNTKKVQPQIIEREYDVPVSVIPKGNEDVSEKAPETNLPANNIADNAQAKAENAGADKTAGTEPKKTNEQTTEKQAADKQATVKQDVRNKPVTENVKPSQQPASVKQETASPAGSLLERKDNKNTLVKSYIFSDGHKYTIQLSSWKKKDIAEKEVIRLRKQGLDAYYTESYVPSVGGTWYRVRVGEFYTIQGAEQALEKIK